MKISIICDNPRSWIVPHAKKLAEKLRKKGLDARVVNSHQEIVTGDIACFLGCEKIASKEILFRNKHNLVVHESALPQGKGWSPLTWQILEGKNKIPITLFEAEEGVDSGVIYFQDYLEFAGHELVDELRQKQGEKTVQLILKFVDAYPKISGRAQRSWGGVILSQKEAGR